ncbi:MAG: recombination mediator RecR [Candidatus Marinimicrobia bacterium]|jgi:recombination protein RecR|nr:recombination mediator RecR [Candidatus Neomarinimicrobiota bacterium]MCK9558895.1 recombination mediator RecR [Candidatus Neomarinimicrobiota bacterium]MDD5061730.1 recombination mediator RecR [Candidatus Neomarinimicrobiota bacterium]MDD5231602.1 recombination mediator RecR [Candidatus Neomarinimicrobiota bacterium]MDD5539341.1 recombination mediator RecR [Candidatus Neomarinimicrobiota bacterium]
MSTLPDSLQNLIERFAKFPGVGRKSAQRLAFYLLKADREEAVALAKAIIDVKDRIFKCSRCYNISETDPCKICTDEKRDHSIICVVQEAMDVLSIEKTGYYRGLYHVLGGVLSPLNGIGPDELNIQGLLYRLDNVREVILAINLTRDGETTALYLSKLLKSKNVKVSRIAQGLPAGIDLEYADEITLTHALEGRTNL